MPFTIPDVLLHNPLIFNHELSDIESQLLESNAPLAEVTDEYKKLFLEESEDNLFKRCICILVANPEVSAADLFGFFKELSLENDVVFDSARFLNRIDLLDLSRPDEIGKDELQLFFEEAAELGYVEVLNWLCQQMLAEDYSQAQIVDDILEINDASIYKNAIHNAHTHVLDWLLEHAEDFIAGQSEAIYNFAIESNQVVLLAWLRKTDPESFTQLFNLDDILVKIDISDAVMDYFLTYPKCFASMLPAIRHPEPRRHIERFVNNKLPQLLLQKDVNDADEAEICIYILQYLIMKNDPDVLERVKFITKFPQVITLLNDNGALVAFQNLLLLSIEEAPTVINYFFGSRRFIPAVAFA